MGTSQSINPTVKNNPNWGDLSKVILSASHNANISNSQLQGIMQHFVTAVGGSSAGHGSSRTFGGSGISRAQRFMSFVSVAKAHGFNEAMSEIGVGDTTGMSVNEFINYLLAYCSEGNSNLDETAANSAIDELLKHILNDVDTIESIQNIFEQANIETQHEWLCFFFASYIMEFSSELFSTRIFENDGNPIRTFEQIRKYLQDSISDIQINLQSIDWHGEQGSVIIKNFQTEILQIWLHE